MRWSKAPKAKTNLLIRLTKVPRGAKLILIALFLDDLSNNGLAKAPYRGPSCHRSQPKEKN
ncbi:unnamed protein product [Acidithrix sp. C25]|nr:unnamed protein product [Acidithrix sp. C25]